VNSFERVVIITATLSVLFCGRASAQERHSAADVQTDTPGSSGQISTHANDAGWHLDLSPYLWFAGAHGTVGARGRDVSVHATPGDLLSHLDIGVMGSAEARHKRFVLNGDLLWTRISDSHSLPIAPLSAVSADVRLGQLVWTSKIGYRVINHEKLKADANVGARFWHLGQKLNFNPSQLGLNFNGSQNWADIVIGGRVQLPMGKKTSVDLLGDVGGWNATAKLDYQFAALLGYKVGSKWTLGVGYRYLFVDYRPGSASIVNLVTSGALIGATYHFR
jgi:hypothetical protein